MTDQSGFSQTPAGLPEPLRVLAARVRDAGGRALLVGGAVRDRLLGQSPTDFDLEIYRLPPDTVGSLARGVGVVREVWKVFGVFAVTAGAAMVHVSLPRRDVKVGPGHGGFAVGVDQQLTPADAAHRRDFTINAIAEDPLTGEVLDPVNGRGDLAARVLRVVDPSTFADDPLRVLRGAVCAAQFGLTVDPASSAVLRATAPRLKEISRERVGGEWRKLLLRSAQPSRGLRLLHDWGAIAALHPEFTALGSVSQNPRWHPEGDVWTHTCLAVDAAAEELRAAVRSDDERWWVLLAVLCHDLGKATTTRWEKGAWRSPRHDAAGVAPTRTFLRCLAADRQTTEIVVRLVREHLQPLLFTRAAERGRPVSDGALRRLARRLHPATMELLALVASADHRGRGPESAATDVAVSAELARRAAALGVLRGPPAPVLTGKDLRALGLPPGPAYGEILRIAEESRDARGATRKDLLRALAGARSAEEALARLRPGRRR